MAKAKPQGRPTSYTDDMGANICALLASGQSLQSICKADDMPHMSTVFRWLAAHESFRDIYAKAREVQADVFADEITDIADSADKDTPSIAKARLQIDARKWIAAKLKPKKYGEKLDLSSNDGSMSPRASKEQRDAAVAAFERMGKNGG